jgi:hypothetical protein
MNAKLTGLDATASAWNGMQGDFYLNCEASLVNRLAVIVQCHKMVDSRTIAEANAATGGAPAGPTPITFAWWLQPGLPPITLDQLAPGVDVRAVIARAIHVPSCAQPCSFDASAFVIETDGVVFVPIDYCERVCTTAPTLALDQVKPAHPWAKKLVDWIRKRVAAGQSLVKNDGSP